MHAAALLGLSRQFLLCRCGCVSTLRCMSSSMKNLQPESLLLIKHRGHVMRDENVGQRSTFKSSK
eukprot:scaffold302846_cov23-Tisochrysis_lutea.AAC.1